jgi:hypothetical protein
LLPKTVAVKDDHFNSPPKDNPNSKIAKKKTPLINLSLIDTEL